MSTEATTATAEKHIWELLDEVMDPEIPNVSLVELGVIDSVAISDGRVGIGMIPTFSGCPALDVMKSDIREKLTEAGYEAKVTVLRKPWSTDRMADSAREKMKTIGLAPPAKHGGNVEWEMFTKIPCPWCESMDTEITSPFGPTLCRAIYYCNSCQQPFERFKQL
ncbi:MAG: phenylacetate-CoA oxygenase subunit PaaJ [Ectothiorhodospiraceae bacterium]|nr:phenylacetate-CoA oxygenase subunit PaaJ [Ectothiorhodospiraceae bacterium]